MTDTALAPLAERTPRLSRKRKAAVIVQLLIGDGGKLELSQLPEDIQLLLAHELGAIKLVDRDTVHNIAAEFARDLGAVGLSSPGGADGAIEALSKLPVARAATVLEKLQGDQARRITYAVSQTEKIAPEMVKRIGIALIKDHCITSAIAFEKAPDARVGAILNSSPAMTRDAVLDALTAEDPAFADTVRKSIFTFKDIPKRLAPTDVPNCIRGVAPEVLATAIAGAFPIKAKIAEEAMRDLSSAIRTLADDGTITLISDTPDDDE